jgi:hypothetical protein
MIRLGRLMAGLALAAAAAAVPGLAGEAPEDARRSGTVLFLTADTAYLDVGRDDGLQEGDAVEVVREGVTIATVKVAHLSSHRASCGLPAGTPDLRVGDVARFTPHALPAAPRAGSAATAAPRRQGDAFRRNGLRGRVGVRYLLVDDHTDANSSLSQPGLDLRLDGTNVGGSTVGLAVDVRTERNYRTRPDGTSETDDRTRVFRMMASWFEPRSGMTLAFGRQYSPALSSVPVFDGVLVDFATIRWRSGLFTGTEPDPIQYDYSTSIRDHGIYAQLHNAPTSSKHWDVTFGGVGSYEQSEINREFFFLNSRYAGPRVILYLAQEVDYNRGWRAEVEPQTIEPTSTFANMEIRATQHLTFRAGYDNRRQVRLYRDRITPETEFDDTNRLGASLGWTWSAGHFMVGMDGRNNTSKTLGDSDFYTLTFGAHGFTSHQVGVSTRSTRYTNTQAEGWLHSLRVGTAIGSRVRVEVSGGLRDETVIEGPVLDTRTTWTGLDLDVNLGRRWFLLISSEQNRGGDLDNLQAFTSLTYRF